jgi:hypothetical protein
MPNNLVVCTKDNGTVLISGVSRFGLDIDKSILHVFNMKDELVGLFPVDFLKYAIVSDETQTN